MLMYARECGWGSGGGLDVIRYGGKRMHLDDSIHVATTSTVSRTGGACGNGAG